MTLKFRLPRYFATSIRRQIGELYVSTAIADLALAMVMLFEPIFLYSVLHLRIEQILIYVASLYAFYILLIPLGAKFSSKFGYEHGIYMSIPFQILFWLSLYFAHLSPW